MYVFSGFSEILLNEEIFKWWHWETIYVYNLLYCLVCRNVMIINIFRSLPPNHIVHKLFLLLLSSFSSYVLYAYFIRFDVYVCRGGEGGWCWNVYQRRRRTVWGPSYPSPVESLIYGDCMQSFFLRMRFPWDPDAVGSGSHVLANYLNGRRETRGVSADITSSSSCDDSVLSLTITSH